MCWIILNELKKNYWGKNTTGKNTKWIFCKKHSCDETHFMNETNLIDKWWNTHTFDILDIDCSLSVFVSLYFFMSFGVAHKYIIYIYIYVCIIIMNPFLSRCLPSLSRTLLWKPNEIKREGDKRENICNTNESTHTHTHTHMLHTARQKCRDEFVRGFFIGFARGSLSFRHSMWSTGTHCYSGNHPPSPPRRAFFKIETKKSLLAVCRICTGRPSVFGPLVSHDVVTS